MKKILLLILMAGVILFGKPSSVFAAIIPDQRFGYGGLYQIAHDLNIPWFYNWGVNTSPHPGQKMFFLVGKIECITVDNLTALESQGLKDDEDRNLYTRLDTILKKFEGKTLKDGRGYLGYGGSAVCNNIDNARKTFLQIAATLAGSYPGSYYQIANEPDWYPYFTPEDYAEYYNIFYTRIKKYDPSAHVMTGGLLSIDPFIYNLPAFFSYDPNNHYKWVDDFRNSYKTKFGYFPPIDVWNIHIYGGTLDWNYHKNMIVDFRDIYLTRIGAAKAPIWISELGLLIMEGGVVHPESPCQTHGCLSAADQLLEWNMIANDFMKPLVNWMKSNDYVQKWFWFYAGETSSWSSLNYATDTYKLSSGDYNPLGIMYKQLAEEGAEKIPNCSITSGPAIVVLGETATYAVYFTSTQGNLGTRLYLGQNGVLKGDIQGTVSYQSNTAATGTFSWTPTAGGTFDVFCRAVNDSIADCRGNPAYVGQLPLYECTGPNAYMTVKVEVPLPGDINSDGKVDSVDFTKMVAEFGHPYTIFDYNILVGNFGK